MFIKLEDEDVVIRFSLNNGNYDQKNNYKINLSTKQYFLEEAKEWTELDWELAEEPLKSRFEDLKLEVKDKILNNRKVIYTSQRLNDEKEERKAKKHLEKNLIIENFLNNYDL